jgi:ABC-type Zn2+ transport system substrate-binding protein/surface adhesin
VGKDLEAPQAKKLKSEMTKRYVKTVHYNCTITKRIAMFFWKPHFVFYQIRKYFFSMYKMYKIPSHTVTEYDLKLSW